MKNNEIKLPNIWGQGACFSYSGLNGENTFTNSLVGYLLGDCIGVEFKTPVRSYIKFKLKDTQNVLYDIVTSDLIKAYTVDMDENEHVFNMMYASENTVVVKATNRVSMRIDFDEEMNVEERNGVKIYTRDELKFAYYDKIDGETVQMAFSYGENADKNVLSAVNIDTDAIAKERIAFYEKLERPVFKDEDEERLYYKCFSVMKSMIYSPEEPIKTYWTTPDRHPHKKMWLWDSAYHSVGMKYISQEMGENTIRALFCGQHEDGYISHSISPLGIQEGVTQPPLLAWAVYELYKEFKNDSFVVEAFDKLEGYLKWDMQNRDLNKNGLLEWIINEEGPENVHCRAGESGMDNTPRFDGESRADSIDFSAFMANEARCLSKLAKIIGYEDKAKEWNDIFENLKAKINAFLWDEEDKFYYDKRLKDGTFIKVKSVASFLTLFAGVCDAEKAEYMVEHLKNPNEFGTPFMIPTVSADDKTYKTMDMFRGTVWLNFNYLIAQGLEAYGYNELAAEIKEKTVEMIKKWYLSDGVVYEFYDSRDKVSPNRLSRKGPAMQPYMQDIKVNSVRDFSWGSCFVVDIISKRKSL
ncbi:MAG: hypothetical protein E7408_01670 [Ruminococcaceae bacterium]|nr:hypothetical protein [Oscillospiraceae bacterium]